MCLLSWIGCTSLLHTSMLPDSLNIVNRCKQMQINSGGALPCIQAACCCNEVRLRGTACVARRSGSPAVRSAGAADFFVQSAHALQEKTKMCSFAAGCWSLRTRKGRESEHVNGASTCSLPCTAIGWFKDSSSIAAHGPKALWLCKRCTASVDNAQCQLHAVSPGHLCFGTLQCTPRIWRSSSRCLKAIPKHVH